MLPGKKFLASAVVAASVLVGSVVAATSAYAISYSIPQGQELYAWDPDAGFLAQLDVANALSRKVDPTASSATVSGYVEGGGYDPVTRSTWVVGDNCQLSTLYPSGFSTQQLSLGSGYRDCWAFLANGDGTAYVSATNVSTNTTVVVEVNLDTNQVVSFSEFSPAATTQITGMARNSSGEVWVSITNGFDGLARLNFDSPQVLSLSNMITMPDEVWDIAFDADGILWLAAWPDTFQLQAIDLTSPDPSPTIFRRGIFNYPFAGAFVSDAMWFPNAYTYATRGSGNSPSPSPDDSSTTPAGSLAATGVNFDGYLVLAGVVLCLGILGIALSRRKLK